jgi:hypothetical protein
MAAMAASPVPRLLCEDLDAPSFLRHFEPLGLTPTQEVRAPCVFIYSHSETVPNALDHPPMYT